MWHGMIGVAFISVFFGTVGFVAYLLYGPPIPQWPLGNPQQMSPQATSTNSVTASDLSDEEGIFFTCETARSLKAAFGASGVRLALSDGRHINVPQVISASGARYANPDESFVFWNSGNTAFIGENGVTTYTGCVTNQQPN